MVCLVLFVIFFAQCTAFMRNAPIVRLNNAIIRGETAIYQSTSDFKNGMTIEIDGAPYKLMEFLHVKPGKGSAFVRTKIKNLNNGSVQEKTFRAGESITAAQVDKTEMQFTYDDGNNLCFMNMETFEEQMIPSDKIENPLLLIPGLSVNVLLWNEQVIDVQLPQVMECKVEEAPPNVKGNTAQGATKTVVLEGGAEVNVPMFIEEGEFIRIDTEEMKYLSRAEK